MANTTRADYDDDFDSEAAAAFGGSAGALEVTSGGLPRSPATAPPNTGDVAGMLQMALERNLPVETLERMVALYERVSDRQAASEFAASLAEFQNECPPITKNSNAEIVTKSGTRFSYTYADLSQIAETVRPFLHPRGFSYSWSDCEVKENSLSVVCTLRHVNGHSARAAFTLPVDNASAMSAQQKVGAALTYAKRMSLTQVLGISTADLDTDSANPEPITAAQLNELKALAKEVNANEERFLGYLGVKSWDEIRKADFSAARTALESKRHAPRGKA